MRTPILLLFLAALPSWSAEGPKRADLELITKNVAEFTLEGSVPGVLKLQENSAAEILSDEEGRPFGAIGLTGTQGRIAAFAHGSFLIPGSLIDQAGVRDLVANTIRWTGKSAKPSVGLSPKLAPLKVILAELGMVARVIKPEDLNTQVDVYCFIGHESISEEGIESVRRFALKGSGVVIAATPWPFGNQYPDFSTFPGNQVGGLAGITFLSDGYASAKRPISLGPPPTDPSGVPLATTTALALAKAPEEVTAQQLKHVRSGARLSGRELDAFQDALFALNQAIGPIIPTQKTPILPGNSPLTDAVVEVTDRLNQSLPPEKIRPIPAADDYPGAAPKDAKRVSRTLVIDSDFKGWINGRNAGANNAPEMRPTGLYAAPGEPIRVTVPSAISAAGFQIVIGAYQGNLHNRDQWCRWPRLQRAFAIEEKQTLAANGLGGLITIRVPRGARFGEQSITIEGAIEAPLYIHGKTALEEWRSRIRHNPAPWAELASERIIIALPSDHIRNLENPDEVMAVWNSFINKAAELAVVDRENYRAERIVFDRQTAAGSMHSGYPVAAHLGDASEQAVDADSLMQNGNWGFFHEYGHNHQHNLWALPNTGETTCNLWSVYLFEEVIGKHRDKTHGAINPLRRQQTRNAYFNNGRKFQEEWSMWVALDSYLQIQETFGWQPYQTVFHEYNTLPKDEWPKTQQEKNDQWVIRMSKACNADLAPFYAAWNLPMSDFVAKETAKLPPWEDHPVRRYVN